MKVEDVIFRNAHVRGIDRLRPYLPDDFCLETARAVYRLAGEKDSPNALITTGFYVGGAPETDGPPGAYFLYRSLKALGFSTKLLTDDFCAPLFEGIVPPGDLMTVPLRAGDRDAWRSRILGAFPPDLLIAVERCGRTRTGTYRDMRGNDISAFTAPIDALFLDPPEGCVTVGIGDGGNEIGMGRLETEIARLLDVAPCVVPVDYLILAAVSNWGACGLLRYLELLFGVSCLPDAEEVKEFLSLIVARGAVDGISRRCEHKVDGYDLSQLLSILVDLKRCGL